MRQNPKYVVQMVNKYTRDIIETLDGEIFDTCEEAEAYAIECSGSFGEGAETHEYRGEGYIDPDDVEFVVTEVETQ